MMRAKKTSSAQKETIRNEIAARIKSRREFLKATRGGYTLDEVAERFSALRGVPITRMGYQKYEIGMNEISVSDLPFIAEALGTEVEYLLGLETPSEDGPATVYYRVHATPQDRIVLDSVAESLARSRRLIEQDARGIGE